MVGTVKALIQQAANAAQVSGNPELAELLDRIANEELLFFVKTVGPVENVDVCDLPWGDFDVIRIDD